jgi:hypothetical protein
MLQVWGPENTTPNQLRHICHNNHGKINVPGRKPSHHHRKGARADLETVPTDLG